MKYLAMLACLIGFAKANAEEWKIRGYYEGVVSLMPGSGAGVAFRRMGGPFHYEIAGSVVMLPNTCRSGIEWTPLFTTSMSRVLMRDPGQFWDVIYDGVGGGLFLMVDSTHFLPWPYLTGYRSWQIRHFHCDFGIHCTAIPDWYEGERFPTIYPVPMPYFRIGGNF